MRIPFLDLRSQFQEIKQSAGRSFQALMQRGDFILGKDVIDFERSFARFVDAKYALGVNSGTDALFLGLLSLGIGPGDEVIVPDYTYIASAFAVSYTGARPVFVDIDERSFNIDPSKIERAITKNTRAIMPVHLYGQSADMAKILTLARKHRLKVIEDAAQAHGAEFRGKKVGALGDAGAFSFYPTKNLGAFGDGGVVVTNKRVLFERLAKLRDYGRRSRYVHSRIGYNSRLDSLQALFLKEKLKRLDVWNRKRARAAESYLKMLGDVEGFTLPVEMDYARHIYHVFSIRSKRRDVLVSHLKKSGIDVMIYYPLPLHRQPVYKSLMYEKDDFPVANKISREVLCLPIHPHMTQEEIVYIVNVLKNIKKEVL